MTIRVTKEQGTSAYVTCKTEKGADRGLVRVFDRVSVDRAREIAEQHDKETGGTHQITLGRHRTIPLDPSLEGPLLAMQEARLRRAAESRGWGAKRN